MLIVDDECESRIISTDYHNDHGLGHRARFEQSICSFVWTQHDRISCQWRGCSLASGHVVEYYVCIVHSHCSHRFVMLWNTENSMGFGDGEKYISFLTDFDGIFH